MRIFSLAASIVLALVVTVGPAAAQTVEETNARLDAIYGEHTTFGDAFDALFNAVSNGDKATVASLVKYPLRVATNGEEYVIDNEQTFIDNYDTIMTPQIVDTIVGQDFALLFVNDEGVMYGDGNVWFADVCLDDACNTAVWLVTTIQETP